LALSVILAISGWSAAQDPFPPRSLPEVNAAPMAPNGNPAHPPLVDVTPPELRAPFEIHPHEEHGPEGGLYGSLEFLLWKPRHRGTDYAIVDPFDDLIPAGQVRNLKYDIRPGLRAGIGYRMPGSQWEAGFTYTYLHSRGDGTLVAPEGGLIYPLPNRPGLADYALSAMANSRIEYNTYDLEFARGIRVDEWMTLRVSTGIRFANIYQSLEAHYNGNLADAAYTRTQSNFDGAGPMFGLEGRWRIGHGLGVYGKVNGGLIYGNTRSGLYDTNNGGATVYADVQDRFRSIVPVVNVGIGLQYEYRGITVRAGYEAVNWFGLIERPTLTDDFSEGKLLPRQADLSLDGFFLQFGLEF
jgi:hypothetical protein